MPIGQASALATGILAQVVSGHEASAYVERGSMCDFLDGMPGPGDPDFNRWLIERAKAYFVNILDSRRGMLHRGSCLHIVFGPDDTTNLVRPLKWTSENRRELEARALSERRILRTARIVIFSAEPLIGMIRDATVGQTAFE